MLKDMTPVQIALAVAGISVLIAWHELGHYALARAFGMRVVRYALGLGPKLVGFTHNNIQYQLCWLPFGGFVQIFGMSPYEPGAVDDPRAFINQPRWQRIIVYAAGPAFNYIMAAGLFFCFFWFFPGGSVHIDDVVPGSAAEEAGLLPGDIIYGINGRSLRSETDFLSRVSAGEPFEVLVRRDLAEGQALIQAKIDELAAKAEPAPAAAPGEEPTAPDEQVAAAAEKARLLALLERMRAQPPPAARTDAGPDVKPRLTPKKTESGYMLGVRYKFAHDTDVRDVSVVEVAVASVATCWSQSVGTLNAFSRLFAGDKDVKLEGPLGIGKHITKAVERGARDFIWILAILSVTLGLLNLLPIPALDGIKILVLLVESVMRRNISPMLQLWMNAIGLILLMGLMLVMTVLDAAALME